MSIVEILETEAENSAIKLHKEGLFWRAYEHSAFLFLNNIKKYSITKKYYKNVKKEVVYLGFPENSIGSVEKICNKLKLTLLKAEKQITIKGLAGFSKSSFEDWKNSIEQAIPKNKLNHGSILDKIRNFPVVSKSPMECQQFLIEIQKELNGTLC